MDEELERERLELLRQWNLRLETPMAAMGVVWIVLMVIEFTNGLSPVLSAATNVIWIIFIIDFCARFFLSPGKLKFLKSNWIVLISLLLPALRAFRFIATFRALRAARAVRSVRMVRILGSINRGIGALSSTLQRRGFGYVLGLTIIVLFAGAAGMYAFEHDQSAAGPEGLKDFGTALWWTGMLLTTMGSGYWPRTGAGRLLCLLLSIYSFAVFGYVTAAVASFLIGRDASEQQGDIAGRKDIEALKKAIEDLREQK